MLIRPELLPDELDRGYLGRVQALNGLTGVRNTLKAIIKWMGLPENAGLDIPRVVFLARVAGLETQDFVRHHTTVPFRRGITDYLSDVRHGCKASWPVLHNGGVSLARRGAYLCSACAEEDLAFHGFSYWRRGHQIPGQLWCEKHSDALHHVPNEWAFLCSPAAFLNSKQASKLRVDVSERLHPFVQTYLESVEILLDRESPYPVHIVMECIRSRERELGVLEGRYRSLAEIVRDTKKRGVSMSWILSVAIDSMRIRAREGGVGIGGFMEKRNGRNTVLGILLSVCELYLSAGFAFLQFDTKSVNVEFNCMRQNIENGEVAC